MTGTDFDSWAEAYDSKPEIEALRQEVPFSGADVLEVGCGSGRLTRRIASDTRDYLAVDMNREVAGNVIDTPEATFARASGECLPLPDCSVDVVLDGWALSAQNVSTALSEYTRVCRPTGTVAILTESWGESDRPDSDYVRLLRKYDPGHEWPDLEETLFSHIDQTVCDVTRTPVTSSYTFPDVDAAVEAFRYHIENYNGREFPLSQRDSMRETLREQYAGQDGSVRLTEHAVLFVGRGAAELEGR